MRTRESSVFAGMRKLEGDSLKMESKKEMPDFIRKRQEVKMWI